MEIFNVIVHDTVLSELAVVERWCWNSPGDEIASEGVRVKISYALLAMKKRCEAFSFHTTGDLVSSLNNIANADGVFIDHPTYRDLAYKLENIKLAFTSEMGREKLFRLTKDEAEYLDNSQLFGSDVSKSFPSEDTTFEIVEAGNCFSLGRYTACVFHLMRVLEKGLKALAEELAVSFTIPFDYQNWQNIIEQIEAKIKLFERQQAGQHKTDALKTYSEIAKQFRYFKDAWRNSVAHSRESYDKGQATSILLHVKEFMQDITKLGLTESQS